MFLNAVRGFCMALADSVPGVSGGTIAFLLGFYDEFINSLNDMIGKDNAKRKAALVFLIKLGIGWVIGFGASVMVLSSLFQVHIYEISSVFLGLTLFAIPLVVKEEWASIKGKAGCLVFTLIGMALVFCISYFNPTNGNGISVNFEHMTGRLCVHHRHGGHHRHGASGNFRFHTASDLRTLCAGDQRDPRIYALKPVLSSGTCYFRTGSSYGYCQHYQDH